MIIIVTIEKEGYKTSELANLIGIEKHNVIQWHKEFKLDIARNTKGHRVFSEKDVEIYKIISVGKREDKTTAEIRKALIHSNLLADQMQLTLNKTPIEKIDLQHFKDELKVLVKGAVQETAAESNQEINTRIGELEKKMDRILECMERQEKQSFLKRLFK